MTDPRDVGCYLEVRRAAQTTCWLDGASAWGAAALQGRSPSPRAAQSRPEPAQRLWTQLRGQAHRTSWGDGLGVFQPQQKIKNRPKATGDQDQGVNIQVTEA